MRTREERIERLVCAEHCRFFKPWQKETSRCGAYRWLVKHSSLSDPLLDSLERLRGERWGALADHDAPILRSVCNGCDYFPASCAYRDPKRAQGATPCGAVRVLHVLLDRGQLSLEELYGPLSGRDTGRVEADAARADT